MKSISRLAKHIYHFVMPQPAPDTGPSKLIEFFDSEADARELIYQVPKELFQAYDTSEPSIYQLVVCRIHLRKESSLPYHEGLTLDVALPDGSLCGHVTMERFGIVSSGEKCCISLPESSALSVGQATASSTSGASMPFHSLNHSSDSVNSLVRPDNALDEIVIYNHPLPVEVQLTVPVHTFNNLQIPLTRAFAAAHAVHQRWPKYSLHSRQCYFFALCVACILLNEVGEWDAHLPALKAARLGFHVSPLPIVPLEGIKAEAEVVLEAYRKAVGHFAEKKSIQEEKSQRLQAEEKAKEAEEKAKQLRIQVEEELQRRQRAEEEVREESQRRQRAEEEAQEESQRRQRAEEEVREEVQRRLQLERQLQQVQAALEAAGIALPKATGLI